jgi:enoyl-CoA hydratase/carnithine racemase
MVNLHLYDFGIFIELTPDDEEKQLLENNIQMALSAGLIELGDAIDLREIKNIKLANQLLKIRRQKKLQRDQQMQQANIQAQAQANAQAQQVAAQAEVQKQQALVQMNMQVEQMKAQLENQKLMQEAEIKKQLMRLEFQMNMQLKTAEAEVYKSKEGFKEDRKDERVNKQASRQSELIDQRQNNTGPKNFESAGNDVLGGFDLGSFEPR